MMRCLGLGCWVSERVEYVLYTQGERYKVYMQREIENWASRSGEEKTEGGREKERKREKDRQQKTDRQTGGEKKEQTGGEKDRQRKKDWAFEEEENYRGRG